MIDVLTFPSPIFSLVIFLSLLGVLLTIYIHYKKSTKQPMVCPLNGHCEEVVTSSFSKFLGMPVELLGMVYYGATAVAYAVFMIIPASATVALTVAFFMICSGAFLFSLYLIFVQIFYLKQHCTWCFGSAGISTIIFLLTTYNAGDTAILILAQYPDILHSLYAIGLALGLGSATLGVLFLGKFLRDLTISTWEADSLHTISQITWLALATIVLSGFMLYVSPQGSYNQPHFSLLQTIILVILAGASSLLDLLITPRLVAIGSGKIINHTPTETRLLRKMGLGLASIIVITWFTTFILATITIGLGAKIIFITYIIALVIGILFSQFFERRLPIK